MRRKLLALSFMFAATVSFSFVVKQEDVKSKLMNKKIPVSVILPDTYSSSKKYPTIYTLHGWSGSNKNFYEKTPVGELADKYDVVFVSPDGGYDSWYIDTDKSKYESFISKELVEFMNKNYSVLDKKEKRAITGLSMGGFGALYIGIKHQDVFGNVASMSGGVNLEQYKYNWGINKVVKANYSDYNIKDIAHMLLGTKSNILFDCGYDDFFISANRELHKKLLDLNVAHDYIERPGAHNWDYWKNSIKYHTLFFTENFNKN